MALDVAAAIDWAFRRQRVLGAFVGDRGGKVLDRAARLAVQGYDVAELLPMHWPVRPDALVVADAVLALGDTLARRLVISCAMTGAVEGPDWLPEGCGRFIPVRRGSGEVAMVWSVSGKRRPLYCPVEFVGAPARMVESARADYRAWHAGVCAVASVLEAHAASLRHTTITGPAAPAEPWRRLGTA